MSTKISSVKFLHPERIIFYIDSSNNYRNTNIKNVLLYNSNLDELRQLDNIVEVEYLVNQLTQQIKNISSEYNYYFSDINYLEILYPNFNKFSEKDSDKFINDSNKINSEAKMYEEKFSLSHALGQENEFVNFLKKYLNYLIKNKLYYRFIDFFIYYYGVNKKNIFNFNMVNIL